MKTVLKFDSGRKGFDKAIFFLLILAGMIAVLGAFWIYTFFKYVNGRFPRLINGVIVIFKLLGQEPNRAGAGDHVPLIVSIARMTYWDINYVFWFEEHF